MADAEHPQIRVRLAGANKVDGLAGHVGHRQRSADLQRIVSVSEQREERARKGEAHLVVDRVKLGQDHPVNTPPFSRRRTRATPDARGAREVPQGAVELGELVDGFVSDESLADKDDLVGLVDGDELRRATFAIRN